MVSYGKNVIFKSLWFNGKMLLCALKLPRTLKKLSDEIYETFTNHSTQFLIRIPDQSFRSEFPIRVPDQSSRSELPIRVPDQSSRSELFFK